MRGRPKKVGSAMTAGSNTGGAMTGGSLSAGSLSAGAKKYKKKKVSMMDDSSMSGDSMSFDEIVKGLNKHKKDMEGGAFSAGKKPAKKPVKKGAMKVVKEVKKADGKITRKQRGEAVKAMMKKHGVSLGEASKMVSKHLKGGGFFDSLLKLAPLATLLI